MIEEALQSGLGEIRRHPQFGVEAGEYQVWKCRMKKWEKKEAPSSSRMPRHLIQPFLIPNNPIRKHSPLTSWPRPVNSISRNLRPKIPVQENSFRVPRGSAGCCKKEGGISGPAQEAP